MPQDRVLFFRAISKHDFKRFCLIPPNKFLYSHLIFYLCLLGNIGSIVEFGKLSRPCEEDFTDGTVAVFADDTFGKATSWVSPGCSIRRGT